MTSGRQKEKGYVTGFAHALDTQHAAELFTAGTISIIFYDSDHLGLNHIKKAPMESKRGCKKGLAVGV